MSLSTPKAVVSSLALSAGLVVGLNPASAGCPPYAQQAPMGLGSAWAVVQGDINGDGLVDLITSVPDDGSVLVRYRDASGGLSTNASYDLGGTRQPWSLALGDIDGDGDLDLAIGWDNRLAIDVLVNEGGVFQPRDSYPSARNPRDVAFADTNGDGMLDIVSANQYDESVGVMLNDGSGGFGAQQLFTVGSVPRGVAVGDLNNDGNIDIVAANNFEHDVSVLLGNGEGTFQPHIRFPVGQTPYAPRIADMNGDGLLDLVTGSQHGESVGVYLNTGGPELFDALLAYDAGGPVRGIAIGDMDGDGDPDIVAALNDALGSTHDGFGSILLNNGDGSFALDQVIGNEDGAGAAVLIDHELDGDLDIVFVGGPAQAGRVAVNRCDPAGACSAIDYESPYSILDLSDLTYFIGAYLNGDPAADIGAPQGVIDLADVTAFIDAFVTGCP